MQHIERSIVCLKESNDRKREVKAAITDGNQRCATQGTYGAPTWVSVAWWHSQASAGRHRGGKRGPMGVAALAEADFDGLVE